MESIKSLPRIEVIMKSCHKLIMLSTLLIMCCREARMRLAVMHCMVFKRGARNNQMMDPRLCCIAEWVNLHKLATSEV